MTIFEGLMAISAILAVTYFLGVIRGAPFVPTNKKTVELMIDAAQIKSREKLVDLGSGDGRIVISAARAGAIAHGFEINPFLVWISRWKIKKAGLADKAFIHEKNFWRVDFSEFDVVTLFGITSIMPKLEAKLKIELKPGSRVVSNIFRFPNWVGEKQGSVHIYTIEK